MHSQPQYPTHVHAYDPNADETHLIKMLSHKFSPMTLREKTLNLTPKVHFLKFLWDSQVSQALGQIGIPALPVDNPRLKSAELYMKNAKINITAYYPAPS